MSILVNKNCAQQDGTLPSASWAPHNFFHPIPTHTCIRWNSSWPQSFQNL